jgi:hypothetical protein
MANYAYVENNEIQGVYDTLLPNWKNYSNFFALENDLDYLKSLGWYKIEKVIPSYDPLTQKLDNVRQWFENGVVYETEEVIELPVEPIIEPVSQEELNIRQWNLIRNQRDQIIASFDWRYVRYNRKIRLVLNPSDDITKLDEYTQALADIPEKQTDPFNIIWPVFSE